MLSDGKSKTANLINKYPERGIYLPHHGAGRPSARLAITPSPSAHYSSGQRAQVTADGYYA